jgi:hypothetical protein
MSDITVRLSLDGVYESISKMYIVWLTRSENIYVHNTHHVTVNTKMTTKEIPEVLLRISAVKNAITFDNV